MMEREVAIEFFKLNLSGTLLHKTHVKVEKSFTFRLPSLALLPQYFTVDR